MDSYTASLLSRLKEQYERWKTEEPFAGAELIRFLDAVGRTAAVMNRSDLAVEADRLSRRMNQQKERKWTSEEALAEMFPLLRCCYEAGESDASFVSPPGRQGPEAAILLCGNDPLFSAYLRGSLQTTPWRFITLPFIEQPAASLVQLGIDCIVVILEEDGADASVFDAFLNDAGRHSYIPVAIVGGNRRKGEELKWYEIGADDVMAKPVAVGEFFIRIRRLVEKKQKIDQLVLIDELTGVYNRKYLPRVYARLRSDLERSRTPSCLALLDLDRFKQVNDRFGHLAGDAVLKKLAAFLLAHTRGMDTVVRFGGEEFVVWLAKTTRNEAHRVLKRLQRQFAAEEIEAGGVRLSCTFSVGFVECDDPDEPLEHWLRLADEALYAAKKSGGCRVEEAKREAVPTDGGRAKKERRQGNGQRWSVAIVDDDELARTVIADLVRKLADEQEREADIYEFSDGLSFLESPVYKGEKRSVVILDRVMPKMDGLEVLRRLRRQQKPYKVMMLTSRQDERDIAQAIDEGADEYVTKPFKWLELEARLRRLLKEFDE
ncbi:Response regulator PleD [Geobacillus sp. 12AMOR1]|nr:Response regulator PleD [Geobacillus sp. 12AMOR1]